MSTKRTWIGWCASLALAGALGLTACHSEPSDSEQRVGTSQQSLNQAGIPWWFVEQPVEWGCDQTVSGSFHGLDSAHLYRFPGKIGYRYTFSFDGQYPQHKGAAIAVYDSENEQLVAFAGEPMDNSVAVEYEAEKSIDYLVGVFSYAWHTTGSYTLTSECERTEYCVEFETTEPDGTPLNNFYAINVGSLVEAKDLLAEQSDIINDAINEGTCADQSAICITLYQPVCGDSPPPQATYSNECAFKVHVRQQAGDTGEYKGHWEDGECNPEGQFCGGIAGIPCPEGFICILDGSYPDAGGYCTHPDCNYDGQDYAAGDTFPSTDGCNTCTCLSSGKVVCTEMACF